MRWELTTSHSHNNFVTDTRSIQHYCDIVIVYMGNLFGKSKPKQKTSEKKNVTQKDRAILDLKITRDKLTKYQKRVSCNSCDVVMQ